MVLGSTCRYRWVKYATQSTYYVPGIPWYSKKKWYVYIPVSLQMWRSFVTAELVSLLSLIIGLKNRHGHWLCWMSTGRKNAV